MKETYEIHLEEEETNLAQTYEHFIIQKIKTNSKGSTPKFAIDVRNIINKPILRETIRNVLRKADSNATKTVCIVYVYVCISKKNVRVSKSLRKQVP